MKRLALVAALLSTSLGVILMAAHYTFAILEPRVRSRLEEALTKSVGRPVHIARISTNFIHRVTLQGVEVSDPHGSTPTAQAREITVSVNFIELPRALLQKEPLVAIGRVQLLEPHILWDSGNPWRWQTRGHHKGLSKPFFFSVTWKRGQIDILDPRLPGFPYRVTNLEGAYRARGPTQELFTELSSPDVPEAKARFTVIGARWYGSLEARQAPVERVRQRMEALTGRAFLPPESVARGPIRLTASLRGRLPLPSHFSRGTLPQWVSEATLTSEGIFWQRSSDQPAWVLTGGLIYKDRVIRPLGLTARFEKTILRFNGQWQPFEPGQPLHGVAEAPALPLRDAHVLLSKKGIALPPLEGTAALRTEWTGSIHRPYATIAVTMPRGHLGQWPMENVTCVARWADGLLTFEKSALTLAKGRVELKGSLTAETLDLTLRGEGLQMASLIPVQNLPSAKGTVHFSARLTGEPTLPHLTGSFQIENFSLAEALQESLEGQFTLTKHDVSLRARSPDDRTTLRLIGHHNDQQLVMEDAEAVLRSGARLTAAGFVTKPAHNMKFTVRAQNLPAEDLPHLRHHLPQLKAAFHFTGKLQGSINNPELSGELASEVVMVRGRSLRDATASLTWNRQRMAIENIQANPGFRGDLRFLQGSPGGWEVRAEMDRADAAWFAGLFPRPVPMSGTLSGRIRIQKEKEWSGQSDLVLQDGTLASLPVQEILLQSEIRQNRWFVEKLSWRQPMGGRLILKGDADLNASRGHYKALADLHSFGQGVVQLDGPLALNGQYGVFSPHGAAGETALRTTAQIRSDDLRLAGRPIGPLDASLALDPQSFKLAQLQWGKLFSAQAALDLTQPEPTWTGLIRTEGLPVRQWQEKLLPEIKEKLEGTLAGTIRLSGSFSNPIFQMTYTWQQGRWRAYTFQAALRASVSQKQVRPLTLSLQTTGHGQLDFTGHMDLSRKELIGKAQLLDLPLDPLSPSFQIPQPIQGRASGTLDVHGPPSALTAEGHVEGKDFLYGPNAKEGIFLESWIAEARWTERKILISNIKAKGKEQEIRISEGSFVDFSQEKGGQIFASCQMRNAQLGAFTLFGGIDLKGAWEIQPKGFASAGELVTRDLYINDFRLEEGAVGFNYYDRLLAFTPPRAGPTLITGTLNLQAAPQLLFSNFSIRGTENELFSLTGELGPDRWNFSLNAAQIAAETLVGLSGFPYPITGTADIKVSGSGNLANPHLSGFVFMRDGRAFGLSFKVASAAFSWRNEQATLTRLKISDPGRYTLSGAGVVPLSTKKTRSPKALPMNFSFRLDEASFTMLQSVFPWVKQSKGDLGAVLKVTGTTAAPRLQGYVRVKNGVWKAEQYLPTLDNFDLLAEFQGDTIVLKECRGQAGDGRFEAEGTLRLAGLEPSAFDLRLRVPSKRGITLILPELAIPESLLSRKLRFLSSASKADVRGELGLKGTQEEPRVTGNVELSNAHFTYPPSSKQPAPPTLRGLLERTAWDLQLAFGEDTWYENELVEANVIGQLRMKGAGDNLRVEGGMDIPQGTLSYLGIQFAVRSGRFEIVSTAADGKWTNTPYLRGVAEARVQTADPITGQSIDDTITLTIDHGPLSEIKPRFTSQVSPSLSQEKLLARVTQLEVENLTPQERNFLYRQQFVRLLDSTLTTPLAKSFLKKTGLVDEFRVSRVLNPAPVALEPGQETTPSASDLLVGTKYTVAKNLTSRLSLGYGVRFERASELEQRRLDLRSDVELSYRWFRNVYVKGLFELPNERLSSEPERRVTVEPRIRFGWWGHSTGKPEVQKSTPTPTAPLTPPTPIPSPFDPKKP